MRNKFFLIACLTCLPLISPVWAELKIGFIDVDRVFENYRETKAATQRLADEEKKFKREMEARQTQLEDARRKNVKSPELEKMARRLEEELKPKRQQLLNLNESLTKKIRGEIVKATQEIARKLGVDPVFDKKVMITGGMDLTDQVIKKLNH